MAPVCAAEGPRAITPTSLGKVECTQHSAAHSCGVALADPLKTQPGFLLDVTYEDAGGFVVGEVWETHGTARHLVRDVREAERRAGYHVRDNRSA
jgi:hypothetical protein